MITDRLMGARHGLSLQQRLLSPRQIGQNAVNKSNVVRRLSEAAIDRCLEYARAMPTPLSAIAFQQLHGAASGVGSGDTAFPPSL
jgi:hypothetical protein